MHNKRHVNFKGITVAKRKEGIIESEYPLDVGKLIIGVINNWEIVIIAFNLGVITFGYNIHVQILICLSEFKLTNAYMTNRPAIKTRVRTWATWQSTFT